MTKKWKKEALHLWLTTNLSKSDIARSLGKPRTTVRDFYSEQRKKTMYKMYSVRAMS